MSIAERAASLGLETCLEFDPAVLEPEERIRNYCRQNECGTYGKNYMCPPYIGTLNEIRDKLRGYKRGLLFQYSLPLDVKNDREGVIRSKLDFHRKTLELEEFVKADGTEKTWGLIGGSCGLCDSCTVLTGKPCSHPDEARASLEAIGIDVSALLGTFGLELEFRDDRITWTGCILVGN